MHPQSRARSHILGHFWWAEEIWSIEMVNLVFLACVSTATTKKGRQLFREKSAPPEKILATPMSDCRGLPGPNNHCALYYELSLCRTIGQVRCVHGLSIVACSCTTHAGSFISIELTLQKNNTGVDT